MRRSLLPVVVGVPPGLLLLRLHAVVGGRKHCLELLHLQLQPLVQGRPLGLAEKSQVSSGSACIIREVIEVKCHGHSSTEAILEVWGLKFCY